MENKEIQQMTRGKAIRKYCLDCSGGKPREVTMCPFPECPLYGFRKGGKGSRAKAIRQYCFRDCMNRSMYEVMRCPTTTCVFWGYRHSKAGNGVNVPDAKGHQAPPCKSGVFEAENGDFKEGVHLSDGDPSHGAGNGGHQGDSSLGDCGGGSRCRKPGRYQHTRSRRSSTTPL